MESIIYFKVENGKRIVFAEGKPKELGATLFSGANGSGKSSLLSFIKSIIGGKKYLPEVPIHEGEKKASAELITQTYHAKLFVPKNGNPKWSLKRKDGEPFKGTCLSVFKDLTGTEMFFNLSTLLALKGKDQVEYIKKTFKIDMSDLDKEREKTYNQRTEINRIAKQSENSAKSIPYNPDVPEFEQSLSELLKEYQEGIDFNSNIEKDRNELKTLSNAENTLHYEIAELEKKLEVAKQTLITVIKQKEALAEKLEWSAPINLSELKMKIDNVEELNASIRKQAERKRFIAEAKEYERQSEKLTEAIANIDEKKKRILSNSKLPEGLNFTEDGLEYQGLPFTEKQTSSAEAMKLLVRIAFAAIPENGLRCVIIENGGLFDQNSLKELDAIAVECNGQLLIEKPDLSKNNCEFFFEAGEIK